MDAADLTTTAHAPAPGGYGLGIGPDGTYTPRAQSLAFLCGLWTMVVFFPLLIPGAMIYSKAEEVFRTDPSRARTMVLWSWLCVSLFPPVALAVTVLMLLGVRASVTVVVWT